MRNYRKRVRLLIISVLLIGAAYGLSNLYADNSMIEGYQKPEVCQQSNIRCILKKQGKTRYWCLKSAIQRNLDTRRSTTPIKKTLRENLGNCAKIVPIRE